MIHWRYRAFDVTQRIHTGVIRGVEEPYAALELRQQGLQLIQLVEIDAEEYTREARRQARENKLKARVLSIIGPTQGPALGGYMFAASGPEPMVVRAPKVGHISRGRATPIRRFVLTVTISVATTATLLLLAYKYLVQSH